MNRVILFMNSVEFLLKINRMFVYDNFCKDLNNLICIHVSDIVT